ncbi:hypothetical protein JJB98_23365 [Bradyrhizobium diazoefficiens]|nr:hypothetical protein [Bradyrhizobium diazoefficiens]QQO22653.1 hypothetical protein JJB98_23365 [Bradyrhizobium diazoefficiens]
MLPALKHSLPRYRHRDQTAANHASFLGDQAATRRVEAAEATIWTKIEARAASQSDKAEDADEQTAARAPQSPPAGPNQCVIACLSDREMKAPRLKELLAQYDGVINKALPLIVLPPLERISLRPKRHRHRAWRSHRQADRSGPANPNPQRTRCG